MNQLIVLTTQAKSGLVQTITYMSDPIALANDTRDISSSSGDSEHCLEDNLK